VGAISAADVLEAQTKIDQPSEMLNGYRLEWVQLAKFRSDRFSTGRCLVPLSSPELPAAVPQFRLGAAELMFAAAAIPMDHDRAASSRCF